MIGASGGTVEISPSLCESHTRSAHHENARAIDPSTSAEMAKGVIVPSNDRSMNDPMIDPPSNEIAPITADAVPANECSGIEVGDKESVHDQQGAKHHQEHDKRWLTSGEPGHGRKSDRDDHETGERDSEHGSQAPPVEQQVVQQHTESKQCCKA